MKKLRSWHLVLSLVLFAQSCLTLCDSKDCDPPVPLSMEFSRQEYWSGLPFSSPENLPDPGTKLMSITSVMSSYHLILCHPLLLLPSIFPSIRIFSNESFLHIMRNTGLEGAQAGIKIAGRNINNHRYADDTTLMAESEVK